jgi:UDP-N-acetylglucosamine:LPS N-acetylglucosamine transferase
VGCVPVTTTCGVFAEKEYCVKVKGEPKSKETQEEIAYKIVELLQNPQELEKFREKFRELAIKETWDKIAQVWLDNLAP